MVGAMRRMSTTPRLWPWAIPSPMMKKEASIWGKLGQLFRERPVAEWPTMRRWRKGVLTTGWKERVEDPAQDLAQRLL